jgi:hypothetical protein
MDEGYRARQIFYALSEVLYSFDKLGFAWACLTSKKIND